MVSITINHLLDNCYFASISQLFGFDFSGPKYKIDWTLAENEK